MVMGDSRQPLPASPPSLAGLPQLPATGTRGAAGPAHRLPWGHFSTSRFPSGGTDSKADSKLSQMRIKVHKSSLEENSKAVQA